MASAGTVGGLRGLRRGPTDFPALPAIWLKFELSEDRLLKWVGVEGVSAKAVLKLAGGGTDVVSAVVSLDRDPTARAPGQYTRSIVQRMRMRTLLTLGALAVATTVMGRRFGWHDPRFLAAEVGLLGAIFAVSRFVLPLVERHDRGATGEEQVGALLEDLRGGRWRVIHDASLGRGNVDHIAIGPGGVFTMETKSHPGPVRVGKVHGGVLNQAQAQRRAIEEVVGAHVEPLVVFSRAWVDRPLTRRKGVRVVPAGMLVGYMERQPERLSEEEVQLAHARLRRALAESGTSTRFSRTLPVRLGWPAAR
jgi:Nuclease-related domain